MDNQAELTTEGLTEEEIESFKSGNTSKPDFPFIVFSAAVIKDIADLASLGTIGIFVSIITSPIIFFYTLGKMGFIKKKLWRRLTFTVVAEFIPGASFIPFSTFFVLSAHATENKHIEKILNMIEKIT